MLLPPKPRGRKRASAPAPTEPAEEKPPKPAPIPSKNDGTLGIDGVQIHPRAWCNCADCARPIHYIRVGEKCVYHSLKVKVADV